ncbi:MAG: tRNA (adenosine(37)-N6)-dimethylallyltransferase MiaA [Clostridia bacterium]|nr:tRNA (adenosine(37)-N6)-dimethylallyltransferase MiaA [Clostridia bacterium]
MVHHLNYPDGSGSPEDRLPEVIAVVGPTAIGKSAYALELAKACRGEIVSGDSMQVYRGMDIGTAKAGPGERKEIPHHLLDIAEIDEAFSAGKFLDCAEKAVRDILSRGKTPVICGGTGLYIELLLTGRKLSDGTPDERLRAELFDYAEKHGAEALHSMLAEEDPEAAAAIHPNNVKRVVRAIEICRRSGMTKTEADRRSKETRQSFSSRVIRMTCRDREALYERIERRVDEMFSRGLENEVRELCARGLRESPTASQAIGYKEFYPYFDGLISIGDVRAAIVANTRHYAKRQETWFRRMHTDETVFV